jgi:hypothetical protein
MRSDPQNLPNLKFIIINNKGATNLEPIENAIFGSVAVIAAMKLPLMSLVAVKLRERKNAKIFESNLMFAENSIDYNYPGFKEVDNAAEGVDTLVVVCNSTFSGVLKSWFFVSMNIELPIGAPPGEFQSIVIDVQNKTYKVI